MKATKASVRSLLSALAAVLLAAPLLAGCGETSAPAAETTAAPAVTEAATTADPDSPEGRLLVDDGLPVKDYAGREFRVLVNDDYSDRDFIAEEETGAVINDAVYRRNAAVEERFGMKLVPVSMEYSKVTGQLTSLISAGEYAYDLVAHHMIQNAAMALQGFYLDLGDVPYLDPDRPWWNQNAWENLSIGGHSYLMYGSITHYGLGSQYCVYMNKRLGEDYGLTGTIYDTVLDGRFTIDYYYDAIRDTWRDLNGNNEVDDQDFFGLAAQVTSYATPFVYAFGEVSVSKDKDGMPVLDMDTAKWSAMVEKLYKFFYESNGAITTTGWSLHSDTFKAGRALFMNGVFQHSYNRFTDLEDDYAMIPYPKWDEKQEAYYTMTDGSSPLVGIPVTVSDTEFAGIVTEALAAEAWKTVIPKVYDVVLKVRGARDDASIEIIDIIANGCVFDMGFVYGNNSMMAGCLQKLMSSKSSNFMSHYEANRAAWEARIDEIIEIFSNK